MKTSQANRGMSFETLIEYANTQYQAKGIAIMQKIPTPVKVIRDGKRIVSAFHAKQSTVDFIGLANGVPIAFDAKSTRNKTSFPLANIEQHQIDFMQRWQEHGGVAFLLVEFAELGEVYRLDMSDLLKWRDVATTGRKSIPVLFFRESCRRVEQGRGVVLDYLAGLDNL